MAHSVLFAPRSVWPYCGVLDVSGTGIAAYDVVQSMTHYRADGWLIDSCILQGCAGNGVNFYGEDTLFRAVHAQTSTGDNFAVQHSNNRLVACRADGSANGHDLPGRSWAAGPPRH